MLYEKKQNKAKKIVVFSTGQTKEEATKIGKKIKLNNVKHKLYTETVEKVLLLNDSIHNMVIYDEQSTGSSNNNIIIIYTYKRRKNTTK